MGPVTAELGGLLPTAATDSPRVAAPQVVLPEPGGQSPTVGLIGRYRLQQVIGRGGSGVVYRAGHDRFPQLPPVVAVKVAHDGRVAGAEFRRQFQAHSRVSALVDHPGVLRLVDGGVDLGRPYLVMPHIDGADLARRLTAGALSLGRVLVLLRQVADALDAMHSQGVLHLDVKPSNVLVGIPVRPPGAPTAEHAFLGDLGLCRFLSDRPGPFSADFVGSPRYASPEHLRGRAVAPAADLYSLTCVLYAALGGRPPYSGDIPAVVTGHLSGPVPSLSALTALPRRVDGVIRRGMHPDPGSRFTSCKELISAARSAILDR